VTAATDDQPAGGAGPALRLVPDLPADAKARHRHPRQRTVRLAAAAPGLPRIGPACHASQSRCGHHGEPEPGELLAALTQAGQPVTTLQLVRLLLRLRGCTAATSHGVRNHLHRIAARDGGGEGWASACERGRARMWWAVAS
jgi:hypothetical protein